MLRWHCLYYFQQVYIFLLGAGSENRTRATRSEAWDSTTKLYPHNYKYYTIKNKNNQQKNV